MNPNLTPPPERAKSCPLCDSDRDFLNVVRIYTRPAFMQHVRHLHPGLDPSTLWDFPLPHRKARG